jgi:tetratricopeptide (TPR) repeat protein
LDVKPENLMIDNNSMLKITDFGLATLMGSKKAELSGTLPYMAPERLDKNSTIDHRADIYSFGIVLYEIYSGGDYPYQISSEGNDTGHQFINAHLYGKPKKINSPLNKIIAKCLVKRAGDRYQNYDALLEAIRLVAKELRIRLPAEVKKDSDAEAEKVYVQAQAQNKLGNKEQALRHIQEYVDKWPGNSCGWSQKAVIHLELEQYEKAQVCLSKSLELDPYNSVNLNNMGILHGKQGNFMEAITAYQRALEFDVGNSGALMNMAEAYFNVKHYSLSSDAYVQAITKYPTKETLIFNAGNSAAMMMKEGLVHEGLKILKALTSARPLIVDYWHNLALCHISLKDKASAEVCFKKVVELNPADVFAWAQLAKRSAENGDSESALAYCDKAIELKEGVVKGSALKAQLLAQTGKYEKAVECLKVAVKQKPQDDTLYFIWANIAINAGKKEEALSMAKKCKQLLEATSPRNVENLAMIHNIIERLA